MLLSIIIVNYNVKYFIEQCLCSVAKALQTAGMKLAAEQENGSAGVIRLSQIPGTGSKTLAEIFVVDNNSSDGSVEWLPTRFPDVQYIFNKDNKGFAAANNQALARAKGKYVLFLNPDTLLPEDSFSACISFMESNPAAGAAGLSMIDGGGRFLKESRRGFPSPWVAFCKLAGLTTLFPHSALFANYYLGHIPSTKDHASPVLSGAYMFVRKQALDKTGGFDARFFLYAEDIDLSYRIEEAGYTNYYIAAPTILHFKGESTKKDARYVKLFYKAMSQFRRKHFRGRGSILFNSLLEGAIWLRRGVAVIYNILRRDSGSKGETTDFSTWVCGDEPETSRLRGLLSARNKVLAPNPEAAEEIIFCQGPGFTFKEIIASMQAGLPKGIYKIHAEGTAAAVGSPTKKERGDAILL